MSMLPKLARISYRMFRRILPPLTWPEIEIAVRKAFIGVHPRVYGYIHYMVFIIGCLVAIPIAYLLHLLGVHLLPCILIVFTAGLFGILFTVFYPYLRLSSMASSIDAKLVSVVGFLALLALAGRRIDEMFEKVAKVEGKGKPVTKVLLRYVRNVRLLGMDLESSMRDVIGACPSERLATIIAAIHEALETSGSPAEYLLSEFRSLVAERRAKLTKSLASITQLAEAFIILVLLGPAIAALTVIIGGAMGVTFAGLTPEDLMALMVLAVIPMSTAVMLILLDSILSQAEVI